MVLIQRANYNYTAKEITQTPNVFQFMLPP